MDRRKFILGTTAVPLAARFAGATVAKENMPAKRPPNVLYVFSDQHRHCALPGEPYNGAIAPNLTAFSRQGMSFEHCISNYPVCSPYRGILMSGKWPMQSGIIDNGLQLPDNCGSIGHAFQDAGYETAYVGKWHLTGDDKVFIPKGPGRQGYEDWHLWAKTNPHFDKSFTFDPNTGAKIQPKGYNCTLMTDQAIEIIRSNKAAGKPWMMMVSWNPPHPPFGDAPSIDKALYDPATLPLRPNVKLNAAHSNALTNEGRLREAQRNYYAHITAVDLEFRRLLDELDHTGQANNTIVVYTSDHGEMMGSHGYMDKRLPWEESCRVPFMVRWPGHIPAGASSDVLLSAVDIYPTLCALAGVPVPEHCVGQDLSAAFLGKSLAREPESTFLMHISKAQATGGDENAAPLFRGIRTKRHTYAVADDGRWCCYDNVEDPFQLHNLVTDAKALPIMKDLDRQVVQYLKAASDPFPYLARTDSISVHHTD